MPSLKRSSLIASAGVLCCRLTGLAREVVYAALFGATGAMDAFNVAFRIPNTLRDLFAEGALSQSYTSVTAKVAESDGSAAAWELTQKITTQLVTLMVALITVGILVTGPMVDLMYKGSPGAQQVGLAAGLCRVMWPFIGFASVSALIMGALNVVGSFGLPMLASAAFNIVSVLCGLGLGLLIDPAYPDKLLHGQPLDPNILYAFAVGVLLGGAAQVAVQLPKLHRSGYRWRANWHWSDPCVKRIWKLMIPGVLAAGITQINVLVNTTFAVNLTPGSVTALGNAFRLWQLPVGLFGVATGMVVLPSVSRLLAQHNGRRDIAAHLAQAIRFVAFFAIPSAVILGLWGVELVSLVFQRGQYSPANTLLTGQVLAAYALGLLGYAGIKIVQPVFIAMEKPLLPMFIALGALAVSVSLNYYFVYVLHANAPWLALTTSVMTTLNFLFYVFYLYRLLGTLCLGTLLPGLLRIAAAALPLAGLCIALDRWWMADFTTWSFFDRFFGLAAAGAAAGLVYLGMCWILRVPELRELGAKVKKTA